MAQEEPPRLAPIVLAREASFRLGDVEVRPATRQIVRDGRSETLEPRIMQVLVALARADGAILTRDDLIALAWNGRVVGDNAIHRAVSKVRELGEALDGAFQLETITKVGYRMIVGAGPADPAAPSPELPASGGRPRRWLLGAGIAGVAAAAGGVSWLLRADPAEARAAELILQSEQVMRSGLPESDFQGVGFLEQAAAIRPDSAAVWGKLALARSIVAEYAPPDEAASAVAATQDAARRALAIDARQADARAALALLLPYFGDWHAAERRMDAVLAIDPRHLPTRDARDFLHVSVGRAREASTSRLEYATADPFHAGYQYKLIYAHWILGQIGEADRAAERALQLWPRHPGAWFGRLWTLAFTGRASRALAHVDDAAARPDLPPSMVEPLHASMVALASGRPADVERAVAAVLASVARGPSASINAILMLNGLGEVDRAFDVAHAYLLERGPLIASVRWRPGQASVNSQRRRKTNPLFVPVSAQMRADKRFVRLAEDIGLADYWRRSGTVPDFLRRGP